MSFDALSPAFNNDIHDTTSFITSSISTDTPSEQPLRLFQSQDITVTRGACLPVFDLAFSAIAKMPLPDQLWSS
jgi:hypothetical protein